MPGGAGSGAYAELQAVSNFSFLHGGSHPQELVATAAALGHEAIAIADRNTLAGVVRGHVAAKEAGIRFIPGARLDLVADLAAPDIAAGGEAGLSLICLPTDRDAWARLAVLLTTGKRRAPKGECWLSATDVLAAAAGQMIIAVPPAGLDDERAHLFEVGLRDFAEVAPAPVFLAASRTCRGSDALRIARLAAHCTWHRVEPEHR